MSLQCKHVSIRTLQGAAVLVAGILIFPRTAVAQEGSSGSDGRNVLVIVLDDVGVDVLSCYGEGATPVGSERGARPYPPTPNIDQILVPRGLRFRNAWSNPTCSPTRASILSGRYCFRTGIGFAIVPGAGGNIQDEFTLPDMLTAHDPSIALGAVGKWHLDDEVTPSDVEVQEAGDAGYQNGYGVSPHQAGFPDYRGAIYNVDDYAEPAIEHTQSDDGDIEDYWQRTQSDSTGNAVTKLCEVYTTTSEVESALDFIADANSAGKRWFLYHCFNSGHTPHHRPPNKLHSYDDVLENEEPDSDDYLVPYYQAMIEAMDAELGNLLGAIDWSTTTVILLGDNGTAFENTRPPFNPLHAKGTPYEGGVNVPLIIAGAGVATEAQGRWCDALVGVIDVFPTVGQLMGIQDVEAFLKEQVGDSGYHTDSVSLVPYLSDPLRDSIRKSVFSEQFSPNVDDPSQAQPQLAVRTIRNSRYKLIRQNTTDKEFYDLSGDPWEKDNLLSNKVLTPEQKTNYNALSGELSAILASP